MAMQDVESAMALTSHRVLALEAHANKAATKDHVTFQTKRSKRGSTQSLQSNQRVKQDEEWEEIKLAADNGATDTVIFPGDLPCIELREGAPYKRGVEYEMANSSLCPNLGGKQFVGVTLKGKPQSVVAQVVNARQRLLSVKKCT